MNISVILYIVFLIAGVGFIYFAFRQKAQAQKAGDSWPTVPGVVTRVARVVAHQLSKWTHLHPAYRPGKVCLPGEWAVLRQQPAGVWQSRRRERKRIPKSPNTRKELR